MRIEFDYSTQLELNLVQICIESQHIMPTGSANSSIESINRSKSGIAIYYTIIVI